MTNNKLVNPANELKDHLPSYFGAGCRQVCYVCNLSQEMAESIVRMSHQGSDGAVQVIPIGEGMRNLLPFLDGIVQELDVVRQKVLGQKVQKKVATAANKGQNNR
jgi:hypothetical protein